MGKFPQIQSSNQCHAEHDLKQNKVSSLSFTFRNDFFLCCMEQPAKVINHRWRWILFTSKTFPVAAFSFFLFDRQFIHNELNWRGNIMIAHAARNNISVLDFGITDIYLQCQKLAARLSSIAKFRKTMRKNVRISCFVFGSSWTLHLYFA